MSSSLRMYLFFFILALITYWYSPKGRRQKEISWTRPFFEKKIVGLENIRKEWSFYHEKTAPWKSWESKTSIGPWKN